MRAAPQPAANAASSAEPRLSRHCPLTCGSRPRQQPSRTNFCLPPRMPCFSRHIKPDHARATSAPGVYARGLGSKVDVLARQSSHSTCTRRRRGLRSAFTPVCDGPERSRPSLRIAATAVHRLPRLVAAVPNGLPSAHGLRLSVAVRQPILTVAGAYAQWALPKPCAPHIPPRHVSPWRAIHPATPGGRYSLPEPTRLTLSLRMHGGFGAQPKRALREIRLATY